MIKPFSIRVTSGHYMMASAYHTCIVVLIGVLSLSACQHNHSSTRPASISDIPEFSGIDLSINETELKALAKERDLLLTLENESDDPPRLYFLIRDDGASLALSFDKEERCMGGNRVQFDKAEVDALRHSKVDNEDP